MIIQNRKTIVEEVVCKCETCNEEYSKDVYTDGDINIKKCHICNSDMCGGTRCKKRFIPESFIQIDMKEQTIRNIIAWSLKKNELYYVCTDCVNSLSLDEVRIKIEECIDDITSKLKYLKDNRL